MKLDSCLCCERPVMPLMDFGATNLVNTYAVTRKYPLQVNRCISCYHLQLDTIVKPEILYQDYSYCSGTGRTAKEYFKEFARLALSYFPRAQSVLDIACNDGSQLDEFANLGIKETHGVDPAANLAPVSIAKGHKVRIAFFEQERIPAGTTFDLITAQNVIGHTPTPLEFLEKCKAIMHDQSRLFVQTSQANMIVNGECDTIYHEHVSYFNAHSMSKLAERAGLKLLDIIMYRIHGTSFVFVFGKAGEPNLRVKDRLDWEFCTGMTSPPLYRWWKMHVAEHLLRLKRLINECSDLDYYTIGCGAAAKGLSILNMMHLRLDLLIDNTPSKIGKKASGMKIAPFEILNSLNKDKILFVILAWNLRKEIQENVLALRNNPVDVFIDTR